VISIHVNPGACRDVPGELVESALRRVLAREGVACAEFSVTFLDDREIARMHAERLGRPQPADVLSFALHERDETPLGDIYVGAEQAVRQAGAEGADVREEMVRLALHGALHVLGHDHPDGPERADCRMFRIQEEVLAAAAAQDGEGPP